MLPVQRLLAHALWLSSAAFAVQAGQPALTATTSATGLPRAPGQEVLVFERAELPFRLVASSDTARVFRLVAP